MSKFKQFSKLKQVVYCKMKGFWGQQNSIYMYMNIKLIMRWKNIIGWKLLAKLSHGSSPANTNVSNFLGRCKG